MASEIAGKSRQVRWAIDFYFMARHFRSWNNHYLILSKLCLRWGAKITHLLHIALYLPRYLFFTPFCCRTFFYWSIFAQEHNIALIFMTVLTALKYKKRLGSSNSNLEWKVAMQKWVLFFICKEWNRARGEKFEGGRRNRINLTLLFPRLLSLHGKGLWSPRAKIIWPEKKRDTCTFPQF